MSLNGKYSPLNLNLLGSLLSGSGIRINAVASQLMGTAVSDTEYTKGECVSGTVLNRLVDSINLAYDKIGTGITQSTYDNLISIGASTIPALGNSKPSTYLITYSGVATRFGFIKAVAAQAAAELNPTGTYSVGNFVSTFNAAEGFKNKTNQAIGSFITAQTFMSGTFSNMNDLITSDITGVSLATLYWGQDLIASGRAIDLAEIDKFGLPSVLLKTLKNNQAITKALSLALMSSGLTASNIDKLLAGQVTTVTQEKQIYAAFNIIVGIDLSDICTIINCQTKGLVSLADLLDPKKLFPNSYKTLTVPRYNARLNPTNSKTYFLIYKGGEPNVLTSMNFGLRLRNILSDQLAYACDAFGTSMQQIKNIKNINIEKFSQIVTNLENVQTLPTGATSIPANTAMITAGYNALAMGTGPGGTYTTCDFFGAMSGLRYQWPFVYQYIMATQTTNLGTIYESMYTLLSGAGPYTNLQTLIDSANAEISSIYSSNSNVATLNSLYDYIGSLLYREQLARSIALPNLADLTSTQQDILAFLDNLGQYANETQDYGSSRVLEAIADTTTTGGNSLIGSMREIRNAERLGLAGLKLDNDVISNTIPKPRTGVSSGYTNTGQATKVPIVTGSATVPGSLAGSPETMLIPDNLSILNIPSTVLTPSEAINEIIRCNCDCWDEL